MPSLIPGYEYDVFISYRQKDNKHDRWVTEFVDNLKGELESTFKEEITVYFDINPHDGLLETHDVDESLKEKLKCLVFIPVISRTYCDPKSYAWEHEFKAFVGQASQDQFGLKVKLPNGNVASRVLPIRIHDLDNDDIKLCESVLGGVLRGVEFIYKESGFNRALKDDDDEKINLNKTRYRNQITKVALAIQEIIIGLHSEQTIPLKDNAKRRKSLKAVDKKEKRTGNEKYTKLNRIKLLSGLGILALLLIVALLGYPKIFKRDKLANWRTSDGRISVAVMPFQNMTNDTIWNIWQDGIQNELINNLTNTEELKVRQTESITRLIQSKGLTKYTSITPAVASSISQKLDANIFIYGSIKKAGAIIRVNAQLIDTKTEDSYKSFQIDGTGDNILNIIDSLSMIVKNFLIISKLEKGVSPDFQQLASASTNSPEAYRYFIYGNNAYYKWDMPTAVKLYSQALSVDSNFTYATLWLSNAYYNLNMFEEAKKWCLRIYEKRDQMSMQLKMQINRVYAKLFETPNEEIKYAKQLQEIDDQLPLNYYVVGRDFYFLNQYDRAIPEFEKALEIYNKWDSKPMWGFNYTLLGHAYHKTGQYKKEKNLYKKAEQDFPDDLILIAMQGILSLTEGDTIESNLNFEKCRSILKSNSYSEAEITDTLAWIYYGSGIPDKAEKLYRQAHSLEPKSMVKLNNLAYFLIDKDRNINEGLELIDIALKLSPDNYSYLHTKGWGLYKQGNFREAQDILQKSWDLRREKAIYNHEAFLHLEAAKKAVTGQK